MSESPRQLHDIASVDALPDDDPLGVLHSVGRALARHGEANPTASQGEALRVVAEFFDASLTAMVRFQENGAHFIGIWAGGRYESDPQMYLSNEILPAGSPMRTEREAIVFEPEAFGPVFGALLRDIGGGSPLLVAPVVDGDDVLGSIVVLSPLAATMGERDLIAVQLCGELLWRNIRNHETRQELARRAEVSEILASIGGRLHEGGVGQARELLDEIFQRVGEHIGAATMITYEIEDGRAVPLAHWPPDRDAPPTIDVDGCLDELATEVPFDASTARTELVERAAPGAGAGVIVPGRASGPLVGMFVAVTDHDRGFSTLEQELLAGVVRLLGQFRLRIGSEIEIIRRGVVDQARSEIAESFVAADAEEIDATVEAALRKVGAVFNARRVRWAEIDVVAGTSTILSEWDDGSRTARPASFGFTNADDIDTSVRLEPFLLTPSTIETMTGICSDSPTLVVPGAPGRNELAVMTLTGPGVGRQLPEDERRTLMDLAGLIEQARNRAAQELESDYRETLDDLKLRLARRFLDRTTLDPGEIIDWSLAELGEALGADILAFSESASATENEVHWWKADQPSADATAALELVNGAFSNQFERILESGEPLDVRSRLLPDGYRQKAEAVSGGEFAMLVVPLRAPGVALLLGVAVLRDRVWLPIETALLQQIIGQIRQFIDVVDTRGRLKFDATHDSLTGLSNRRLLTENVEQMLEAGRDIAVLMIDVDRFKVINDSLGHSAGDLVLVTLADRIRQSVRAEDLVGRFGGDEFAIVLVDAVDDLELAAAAQRLIEVIRQPIDVRGSTVIPTCSVGIAAASPGDGVESIVRHADAALYDAKAKGRDCYEFFDDAHRQSLRDRLHLETRLRSAVAAGEFVPWFQPEVDLLRNEVVGVEALVRWDNPAKGMLDASRFIDTAEEIGLAPELSRMVLDQSLRSLRDWSNQGITTRLRVNIAAAQLQSNDLAHQITDALAEHDLPADQLCIEITERSLMLDLDTAIDVLREVRELGVEVAVDDFGTGFSSLARLKNLPVDTLKIDRSFVSGIVDSATDREIVRTIIWLSRGLGLDVVAEGVEHVDQADMLLELGCRRAQGWLWSRAVPAYEVPDLVASSTLARPPS